MRRKVAVAGLVCACAVFLGALLFSGANLAAANSPVADAAMHGDKSAVVALLKQKADVNAPQAGGATALQWAAYRNDLEMADALIAARADVKAANRDGATALQLAAINGSAPMIERLLKAGADANEKSPHGETPLMFASRSGKVDAMKVLLDHKADVNAQEDLRGTTALMWAAEQRHPEAVKLLVASGANTMLITKPDSKGGTAYLAPSVQ